MKKSICAGATDRKITYMSIEEVREYGKKALSTVLKIEKNVEVLERNTFEKYGPTKDDYSRAIMQIIGDVLKGEKLGDILKGIKSVSYGWDHVQYQEALSRLEEQDDFIVNPFQVEEGVLQCNCGSRKVFSFSKQTRSADEPMTTYAECVACNSKWTYSG